MENSNDLDMVQLRMALEAGVCIDEEDVGNDGWDIVRVTMAGYPSKVEVEATVVGSPHPIEMT